MKMRTGIGIHQLIIHGLDKGRAIKEPNATTKKIPPTKNFANSPEKNGYHPGRWQASQAL